MKSGEYGPSSSIPEVNHSKRGIDLLRNFVCDICGARGDWTPQHFIDETIRQVQAKRWAKREERSAGFLAGWIPRWPLIINKAIGRPPDLSVCQ